MAGTVGREFGLLPKILLVDDDELVRRVVKVVLEAEGYEVREAGDGEDAMAHARSYRPNGIVLDLVIPGMDGYQLCRTLKEEQPGACILVLTSVPIADSEDVAREAGADDVMAKPFSALELLRRVSELVKR